MPLGNALIVGCSGSERAERWRGWWENPSLHKKIGNKFPPIPNAPIMRQPFLSLIWPWNSFEYEVPRQPTAEYFNVFNDIQCAIPKSHTCIQAISRSRHTSEAYVAASAYCRSRMHRLLNCCGKDLREHREFTALANPAECSALHRLVGQIVLLCREDHNRNTRPLHTAN